MCAFLDSCAKANAPPGEEIMLLGRMIWSEVFPTSLVDFPLNVHRIGSGIPILVPGY